MRVLILGGTGMLGHKAYQVLAQKCDTFVTVREFDDRVKRLLLFDPTRVIEHVDAFRFESVEQALDRVRPQVVLNAVGIIKQSELAQSPKVSIYINSLFPHLLAEACTARGCKLIHISTDCVFSGRKGKYVESDPSDAGDLYGRSKFLGEVAEGGHLTLRTSIIGHELFTRFGLIEWFLAQRGKTVRGYAHAIFSGLTTATLSAEILRVTTHHASLSGVYQLSVDPIDKYRLLTLVQSVYGADITIEPFDEFRCDRSLDSTRYREATGFMPPSWDSMIREMHNDYSTYDQWRKQ